MAVAFICGIYDSKLFFDSFTYERFISHTQLQTLTAFAVGQSRRHHLLSHCDLCENLHPSPVPPNIHAFQERELTSIHRNPYLYLELGGVLLSEHPLLDLHLHSS